jgi:hypothetical protein
VLFCIGSDHHVTVTQQRRLVAMRRASERPDAIAQGPALLRIPRGEVDEEQVRASIEPYRPTAVFLSGGDTASLVCRALGVEWIEIAGEFAPGIPLGTLRGGSFDGVPVVTKSGGFGAPHTLIEIADYFHG